MLRIETIGNLTKDPECRVVRSNGSEVTIVNFTVAANHGYGEKGSKVYIAGTPSVNAYVNRDGNVVGNLELQLEEIEFLSGKPTDTPGPCNAEADVDELL